jgi:hypothetical protein
MLSANHWCRHNWNALRHKKSGIIVFFRGATMPPADIMRRAYARLAARLQALSTDTFAIEGEDERRLRFVQESSGFRECHEAH